MGGKWLGEKQGYGDHEDSSITQVFWGGLGTKKR